MDSSVAANKKMSISLILSFMLIILLLFLSEWNFLTDNFRGPHEIVSFFSGACMIVFPFEAVIWCMIWKDYRPVKKAAPSVNAFLNAASIFMLILCIPLYTFYVSSTRIAGYSSDIDKYRKNSAYYICLNEQEIRITKEQYDQIDTSELYGFEYVYNKLLPDENSILFFNISLVDI